MPWGPPVWPFDQVQAGQTSLQAPSGLFGACLTRPSSLPVGDSPLRLPRSHGPVGSVDLHHLGPGDQCRLSYLRSLAGACAPYTHVPQRYWLRGKVRTGSPCCSGPVCRACPIPAVPSSSPCGTRGREPDTWLSPQPGAPRAMTRCDGWSSQPDRCGPAPAVPLLRIERTPCCRSRSLCVPSSRKCSKRAALRGLCMACPIVSRPAT